MAVIAIYGASHCGGEEVLKMVAGESGCQLISNNSYYDTSFGRKLQRDLLAALDGESTELIKQIERDRLRNLAYLRAAQAELIVKDNIVVNGLASLLLPRGISHILRVCLVGDLEFRITQVVKAAKITEKDARSQIKKEDKAIFEWTQNTLGHSPWDEDKYDIVIPMNSSSVENAAALILECAKNESVLPTAASLRAADNCLLAFRVKATLAEKKHDVDVEADGGSVTITLKKFVVRLESHKNELRKIAEQITGVALVDFKIGQDFKMPSTWPPMDFDIPQKVLLVDDEREFVQTLSERLQRRKIDTTIAYDGEQALEFVSKDQPEVMVLDLKMPGIDGIEVLRRIKKDHPETEVIILTGHGSERERMLAAELGAFAYLEKPVDIDILSETMKQAYAKVNLAKQARTDSSEEVP